MKVCKIPGCGNSIPAMIAGQDLCVGHFLDQVFDHASAGLAFSSKSLPLDQSTLTCLLDDAHAVAQLLSEPGETLADGPRERILEFLLCVANLHEYAACTPMERGLVN